MKTTRIDFPVQGMTCASCVARIEKGRAGVYFETVAILHTLIILGRFLEARARGRTSEAIKKLMGLRAKTARAVRDGREVDIPVEEVQVGDVVVVRPGEKIPVDGIVRQGASAGVEGRQLLLGNLKLMADDGVELNSLANRVVAAMHR